MQALDKALKGSQSRAALEILTARRRTTAPPSAGPWPIGSSATLPHLATRFSRYLQMSGRLRERDAWVTC